MPAADARQLIAEVKEGSHDAFRELVRLHMKQVYNLAYGFVQDHDDAEDIAQEAFVKAYRGLNSYRSEAEFGTWLYRIVTNTSLDRLKQRQRRSKKQVAMDHPETYRAIKDPTSMYEVDLKMHVERALHELPTIQRAVVILRHMEGLSTRQVSSILRCSEGTVKTHLHRGLKKMRKLLQFVKDEPI